MMPGSHDTPALQGCTLCGMAIAFCIRNLAWTACAGGAQGPQSQSTGWSNRCCTPEVATVGHNTQLLIPSCMSNQRHIHSQACVSLLTPQLGVAVLLQLCQL